MFTLNDTSLEWAKFLLASARLLKSKLNLHTHMELFTGATHMNGSDIETIEDLISKNSTF